MTPTRYPTRWTWALWGFLFGAAILGLVSRRAIVTFDPPAVEADDTGCGP